MTVLEKKNLDLIIIKHISLVKIATNLQSKNGRLSIEYMEIDKVHSKINLLRRKQEGHYMSAKGIVHQDNVTVVCLRCWDSKFHKANNNVCKIV